MPIAVPGSGESNQELQRRIAQLEMTLGNYESIWVTVDLPDGGRQQMEVIARRGGEGETTTNLTPWALTLGGNSADGWTWQVAQNGGTILDETNGNPVSVSTFDDPQSITVTKWIVAESTITDGVPGSFTISAVDEADSKEVGVSATAPFPQEKLRLRIGKVLFTDGEAVAIQYATSSQIIVNGFLTGQLVKMLASHPSA